MSNYSIVTVLFSLFGLQIGFAQTPPIVELCQLPSSVLETSGLENGPNGWFWTHNDSGNPAQLFCIDTTGVIQRTVDVIGDPNVDWEELAKDQDGNLYIGNFGNNSLSRTDLRIAKIPSIDTCTTVAYVSDTIHFSFPDQTSFPPNGTYGNFDMEAMFHYQNQLHLFSKDRSDPSNGYTKHYTLPSVGGTYVANLVDSFETGHANYIFAVTAADVSEDGEQMVLLSSNKMWVFLEYAGSDFFSGTVFELNLSIFSQKEGICFRNDFVYVTDEASFGLGGKLYRIHPGIFVAVQQLESENAVLPVYDPNMQLESVKVSGSNSTAVFEWKLIDLSGRIISTGSILDGMLYRRDLPLLNGLYLLQIDQAETTSTVVVRL